MLKLLFNVAVSIVAEFRVKLSIRKSSLLSVSTKILRANYYKLATRVTNITSSCVSRTSGNFPCSDRSSWVLSAIGAGDAFCGVVQNCAVKWSFTVRSRTVPSIVTFIWKKLSFKIYWILKKVNTNLLRELRPARISTLCPSVSFPAVRHKWVVLVGTYHRRLQAGQFLCSKALKIAGCWII